MTIDKESVDLLVWSHFFAQKAWESEERESYRESEEGEEDTKTSWNWSLCSELVG